MKLLEQQRQIQVSPIIKNIDGSIRGSIQKFQSEKKGTTQEEDDDERDENDYDDQATEGGPQMALGEDDRQMDTQTPFKPHHENIQFQLYQRPETEREQLQTQRSDYSVEVIEFHRPNRLFNRSDNG